MTVTSTNYSSLDEVWGETFNPTQKPKKEKKKKVHDPICELYEMGNNNGYNDNDIVNYANSYFEKYDKTPYQRSMNNDRNQPDDVLPGQSRQQVSQVSQERERPLREVTISNDRSMYDVSEEDDITERTKPTRKEAFQQSLPTRYFVDKPQHSNKNNKHHVDDSDDEDVETSPSNGFAFIDLILYIISGIILIFMMEQFVKIGLLLQ
jgi:hypothetical protein